MRINIDTDLSFEGGVMYAYAPHPGRLYGPLQRAALEVDGVVHATRVVDLSTHIAIEVPATLATTAEGQPHLSGTLVLREFGHHTRIPIDVRRELATAGTDLKELPHHERRQGLLLIAESVDETIRRSRIAALVTSCLAAARRRASDAAT